MSICGMDLNLEWKVEFVTFSFPPSFIVRSCKNVTLVGI